MKHELQEAAQQSARNIVRNVCRSDYMSADIAHLEKDIANTIYDHHRHLADPEVLAEFVPKVEGMTTPSLTADKLKEAAIRAAKTIFHEMDVTIDVAGRNLSGEEYYAEATGKIRDLILAELQAAQPNHLPEGGGERAIITRSIEAGKLVAKALAPEAPPPAESKELKEAVDVLSYLRIGAAISHYGGGKVQDWINALIEGQRRPEEALGSEHYSTKVEYAAAGMEGYELEVKAWRECAERWEAKAASLESALQDSQRRLEDLEKEHRIVTADRNGVMEINKIHRDRIASLEAALAESCREVNDLVKRKDALANQNRDNHDLYLKAEAALSEGQREVKAAKHKAQEQGRIACELFDEVKSLEAANETLEAEVAKLREWATKVAHAVGFAVPADVGQYIGKWRAVESGVLTNIHERNRRLAMMEAALPNPQTTERGGA